MDPNHCQLISCMCGLLYFLALAISIAQCQTRLEMLLRMRHHPPTIIMLPALSPTHQARLYAALAHGLVAAQLLLVPRAHLVELRVQPEVVGCVLLRLKHLLGALSRQLA